MLGVDFIGAGFKRAATKFSGNRLAYYLPYNFFIGEPDEGIVLLKPGALMRCYSFTCPDLGSESAEYINGISGYFNEAIRQLGDNWSIHFECRRELSTDYPGSKWSNELGFLIDSRRKDIFKNYLPHFLNYFFITLTYAVSSDLVTKGATLLYKKEDGEVDTEYYGMRHIEQEMDHFRSMCDAFTSYVQSRVPLTPLDNGMCATYIKSCLSTRWRTQKAPGYPQFFDAFITDEDLDTSTTLKLGDRYIPIIAIRDFPSETYPAILHAISMAGMEFRWTTRWIAMDKQAASKLITKYQKRFNNARRSWGQAFVEAFGNVSTDRIDAAAVAFEAETKEAKVMLSRGGASFGYYTSCVEVWDSDYDAAINKAKEVIKIINSCGFSAKLETSNSLQAWLGMLPGNNYADVHRTLVSSINAAHVIPISSAWTGDFSNSWTDEHVGCSAPLLTASSDGSPFFLNLNVNDVFHTFIFGPSGAGKSTFLCLLESQFQKYRDAEIIILDKDKTARGVCMAAGGSYVEPGADDVAFQPLREIDTEEELTWAQEFIELCLEQQHMTLTPGQKESIRRALLQMRDTKLPDVRDISTFQQYVQDSDVRDGIQPYTLDGQYGRIFDSRRTNIANSSFTMIEMGVLMNMGEACVIPALMFLFRFIEKKFAKENDSAGHMSLLVLDEAWVFLDNPYFQVRIDTWLRTLRKKRVAVVFATQDVPSVAKSKIAATIVSQCQTRIFLADPNAASEMLSVAYRQFGLEDSEILNLSGARMKRDYFYKSPNGARMFQLDLDKYQLALIAPPSRLLDALESEYGRNSGVQLAGEMLVRQGIDPLYLRRYK